MRLLEPAADVARRVLVPLARGCARALSQGLARAGGVGLALHFVAVTLAGPVGAARELVFRRAGRSNTAGGAGGAVRGREAERRDISVDHVAARRTGVRVREGGLVHDVCATTTVRCAAGAALLAESPM